MLRALFGHYIITCMIF